MVLPPKVAPFAASNRSFVRESRARELETKQQALFLSSSQQPAAAGAAAGDISPSAIIEAKTLQDERTALLLLESSNNRSFVKQSRAKQQQQPKESTIAEKPTAASKKAVYRELLTSTTDRSFVKQVSRNTQKYEKNLSFQGCLATTPDALIAARRDARRFTQQISDSSLISTGSLALSSNAGDNKTGPHAAAAASPATSSCVSSASRPRGSSYWAEWAANEDVENVVAMLNMTVDPSLNLTTATNMTSSSSSPPPNEATAAKNNRQLENSSDNDHPKEEIDAIAALNVREEIHNDAEEDSDDQDITNNLNDASINTFTALNITHATVNVSVLAPVDETTVSSSSSGELSIGEQAMEDSCTATQLLSEKKYEPALELFQKAVHAYESLGEATLVATVNRAGCHRNLATVCRALERYEEAVQHLQTAQSLYMQCRAELELKNEQAVMTLDGQLLENSKVAGDVSTSQMQDEYVCLDEMILVTLQSQATFYVKYQDDIEHAVECHEQALEKLLQINRFKHWEAMSEYLVIHEGITFTPLPKDRHTALMTTSLEALGKLYRVLEPGTTTPCLVVYEDALDILQARMEQEDPENDAMIHSVAKILRCLSEIYFQRKELDRAVDALHDSTAVKLRASGAPCMESLAVMDKMGAANEKMKNWSKALLCYEQTLLARSKYYGNTHVQVATSLVNVARVMELKDGTSEESLDLFRAASAIFELQNDQETALEKLASTKQEAETLLKSIPDALRHGNYDKAVEHLQQCLALSNDNADMTMDRAQVYFDLGRAYMGLNDYKQASACLVEAVRNAGDGVSDGQVVAMMQNFGFSQLSTKASQDSKDYDTDEAGDTFDDPPLSLASIDLEMQREDEEEERKMHDRSYRARLSKELLNVSQNPHHQILYESFVLEDPASSPEKDAPTVRATPTRAARRTLRERVWTEKNRELPAKLAKKLAEKMKQLQKKKLPKKLKKLGSKYWKRAFRRTTGKASPFRCIVNTEASLMVIEEEEQQLQDDEEHGGEFRVLAVAEPQRRRVRSVLIEEEESGGFSVQSRELVEGS